MARSSLYSQPSRPCSGLVAVWVVAACLASACTDSPGTPRGVADAGAVDVLAADSAVAAVDSAAPDTATTDDAGTQSDVVSAPSDGSGLETDAASSDTTSSAAPTVTTKASFKVVSEEGVVYGQGLVDAAWGASPGTKTDLLLDSYRPKNAPGLRPGIVLIHGGGFTGGSRKHSALVTLAKVLAARGWVAVSIDYRLAKTKGTIPAAWNKAAGATPSPDQVRAMYLAARDAKAAVRWMHANATKLKIDPAHIAVGGGSAGAYTAIGVGLSNANDFRDELSDQQDVTRASTHLSASAKVAAVIDFWGAGTMLDLLAAQDGKTRFDAGDPPLAIIHGTADKTVLFSHAETLKQRYDAAKLPYAYYPLQGAGHGPWGAKVGDKTLIALSFDFLVKHQALQLAP